MNRLDSPPVTPSPVDPTTGSLHDAPAQGGDAVHQAADKAGGATHRNADRWINQAGAWRDGACDHIRAHPMRSVLIATGTGMMLTLLLRALNR